MTSSGTTDIQTHLPESPEEIRRKLDQEIAELEARLVVLKAARNNLAPIACLHPEILQEIFFFAQAADEHKGKVALLITWVCHRWRELAPHISALWSHIDIKHPQFIEMALSRAKNRDLAFDLDYSESHSPFTSIQTRDMLLFLQHLDRIRTLKFTGSGTGLMEEHASAWANPAPILTELHLKHFIMPPMTFSGVYPALQSLYLDSCRGPWDKTPLPSGLKELAISSPIIRTSIVKLLKFLQPVIGSLERLTLRHFLDADDVSNTPPDKISFENLRQLKLDEEIPPEGAQFFTYISVSPRTNIEVSILESDGMEADLTSMVSALILARNLEKWPIDHVEFSTKQFPVCLRIVEDWSKADDISDEQVANDDNETQIVLHLGFERMRAATFVFDLLPIDSTEKITFEGHANDLDLSMFDYLGKFSQLRQLLILGTSIDPFLNFVRTNAERVFRETAVEADQELIDPVKVAAVQKVLMFPKLRELQLRGLHDPVFSKRLDALRAWLKWRQSAGIGLESLHLSGLVVPSISGLQDLLADVVGELRMDNVDEDEDVDVGNVDVDMDEGDVADLDDTDENVDGDADGGDGDEDEDEDEDAI